MRKPESGCKGCVDRHENCHSECEKYKEYRQELEDYKAWLHATRGQEIAASAKPWRYKNRVKHSNKGWIYKNESGKSIFK